MIRSKSREILFTYSECMIVPFKAYRGGKKRLVDVYDLISGQYVRVRTTCESDFFNNALFAVGPLSERLILARVVPASPLEKTEDFEPVYTRLTKASLRRQREVIQDFPEHFV